MKRPIPNLIIACALTLASALSAQAAAFTFRSEESVFEFNDRGQIVSITELPSGRRLLAKPSPFAGITGVADGRYRGATATEMRDGCLVFSFDGSDAEIVVRPEPFDGGFTFRVVGFSVPDAKGLYLGRVVPTMRRWIGRRACMASDERSGLCVRAYDLHSEMHASRGLLQVAVPAEKAMGSRIGIVGAARSRLQPALRAMTIASGKPHSPAGGAWALGSEMTRGSYLNANVTAASLDDWIDLVERGGFDVLHFREKWYSCRGHYPVNTNDWPGGVADMKAAVEKIHAAGYRAGLHTLTACIDPKDPWVAGPENSQLIALKTYTLAEPLAPDADVMTVNEPPGVHHDTVFTYSGNGNAFRIGNEIVQYTSFSAKPPYRYSGLVRGAFGTRPAAHSKGAAAGYLQQRYIAFYPEPDSPLADALADTIGDIYNTCGFDQIYCDGAEGMRSAYGVATMRKKIMERCVSDGRPCLNEDSCSGSAHSWWFHSRVGAWDSCYWAPKRFHDFHVDRVKSANVRNTDLLEVQMGWWAPLLSCRHFPSQKLDEMEYYASRNAGLDASMSIAGIHIGRRELGFHSSRMITLLGWYERARRAGAFLPDVQKAFDRRGAEFRFRQNGASGMWEVSPVSESSFRAVSRETERKAMHFGAPSEKTLLRVEALYAGEPPNGKTEVVATAGTAASSLKRRTAGEKVTIGVEESRTRDGRRAFRLMARNEGESSLGAWACASAEFRPYLKLGSRFVMRFSVKGDGSGALLNVQPETPPEYGHALAEHYVTLDFTGWRDFEMPLRERDAARYPDYQWPYRGYAAVFHRIINYDNVSAVNFYLNGIPAGGKTEVEVSDVTFVPQRQLRTVRHEVRVNGTAVPVPFAMYSGWFAELEDGVWTLYSAYGDPLRRMPAQVKAPALKVGANEIAYSGETADGAHPRTEVKVFAVGGAEKALAPISAISTSLRRHLSYEAADPQFYAPEKGFDALAPIVMRPDEQASAELILYGPMPACRLTVGGVVNELPSVAKNTHRKFQLAGKHGGICPVTVEITGVGEIAARFEFIKRYRMEPPEGLQ